MENGVQAVDAAFREKYDLVFMDCQMPEMDGYTAARIIRERENAGNAENGTDYHLPIIALTANALAGDRNHCITAGMDDHLSKPFEIDQLRTVIERWLDGKRMVVPVAVHVEMRETECDEVAFDRENYLERLGGEDEPLRRLVVKFVDTTSVRLNDIRGSMVQGNREGIRLHAHSIKGAASSIGAERMRTISAQLEDASKSGIATEMTGLFTALEQAYETFKTVAGDIINEPAQDG